MNYFSFCCFHKFSHFCSFLPYLIGACKTTNTILLMQIHSEWPLNYVMLSLQVVVIVIYLVRQPWCWPCSYYCLFLLPFTSPSSLEYKRWCNVLSSLVNKWYWNHTVFYLHLWTFGLTIISTSRHNINKLIKQKISHNEFIFPKHLKYAF